MSANSTILVTGASGFIGSALLPKLVAAGYIVHTTSRSQTTGSAQETASHQLDLSDAVQVRRLLSVLKPRQIVHLSGCADASRRQDLAAPTFYGNAVSTVNLLTVAAEIGCERFVFVPSMEEPFVGNNPTWPTSPYSASKWVGTVYAEMYHRLFQLPVTGLRPFFVYGPGRQRATKLVPYVTGNLLRGQRPKIGSGLREIDFVYIDDVVDAFLAALRDPRAVGKTLDIGSGQAVPIRQVALTIANEIGNGTSPDFDPTLDRPNEGSPVAKLATTRKYLDWIPSVALEEGIRRTVAWYRAQQGCLNTQAGQG